MPFINIGLPEKFWEGLKGRMDVAVVVNPENVN